MKVVRLYVENGKKMNSKKFLILRRKRRSFDQFFAVGQVCILDKIDHDRKYTSAKFQGEIRTFHTIDVMLRYDRRYFVSGRNIF